MAVDNSAEISRLNSEIQANNNQINQCRAQIDQNYRDIEELNSMIIHYNELNSVLQNVAGEAFSIFQRLPEFGHTTAHPGSIINLNFFAPLFDVVKGSQYNSAKSSVENAISKLRSQINRIQEEISGLNSQISNCNSNINAMNSSKASLEQEQNSAE